MNKGYSSIRQTYQVIGKPGPGNLSLHSWKGKVESTLLQLCPVSKNEANGSCAHAVPGSKPTKWMSPSIPLIRMSVGTQRDREHYASGAPSTRNVTPTIAMFLSKCPPPLSVGRIPWEHYLSHVHETRFGQHGVSWNDMSHFLLHHLESHATTILLFLPP